MLGLFLGKDEEKHIRHTHLEVLSMQNSFSWQNSLASEILGFKLAGEVGFWFCFCWFFAMFSILDNNEAGVVEEGGHK